MYVACLCVHLHRRARQTNDVERCKWSAGWRQSHCDFILWVKGERERERWFQNGLIRHIWKLILEQRKRLSKYMRRSQNTIDMKKLQQCHPFPPIIHSGLGCINLSMHVRHPTLLCISLTHWGPSKCYITKLTTLQCILIYLYYNFCAKRSHKISCYFP